ncbi:MAG: protein-disulfide reductase DsbD domain-containing protein, partial [Planctomycetaceae bacterium]
HGSTLGQIVYPKGQPLHVEGMDKPIMVYEKQVAIRGTLTVPKDAAGKTEEFELVVHYQACNDKECKAPTKVKLNGKVLVAVPGEPIKSVNKNVFGKGTEVR